MIRGLSRLGNGLGEARWSSSSAWHSVKTHERLTVPTEVLDSEQIPLTLTDVHLRHEQLPFAYFFRETLSQEDLISSLKRVVRRYPILGGTLNLHGIPAVEMDLDDYVPVSVGHSPVPLSEWLQDAQQHVHRVGHHPQLLPLFDDLSSKRWAPVEQFGTDGTVGTLSNKAMGLRERDGLATVRITYPVGGGTILGVNVSHGLADAASCFRFVQCWGREMQGLDHPRGASNQRSQATCSGMISLELAAILNLPEFRPLKFAWYDSIHKLLSWYEERNVNEHEDSTPLDLLRTDDTHEYVELPFSVELLEIMKAFGIEHCRSSQNDGTTEFLSTNDMITAFSWLLKRHLSGEHDWNMSMVVNLRGRSDVDCFSHIGDGESEAGVFGNGISNIVAVMPATSVQLSSATGLISLNDIAVAAVAIREALSIGLLTIQDRLALSRMGRARSTPAGLSFATTSWRQFPLWEISFTQGTSVAGFHGHPSQTLPAGQSFASVLVPTRHGGCSISVLAPVGKAELAREIHNQLCSLFVAWNNERQKYAHRRIET